MMLKLFSAVPGRDNDGVNGSILHCIFDKINDWTAENLYHWFRSSERKWAKTRALATCHDDPIHVQTSATA